MIRPRPGRTFTRRVLGLIAMTIALYALLTGLRSSVLRASVMLLLLEGARTAQRKADPVTSLSAAGFAILAFRPLELFAAGFQLSFGAALGLTLLAGSGPKIRVQILPVGAISSRFDTEFQSAGINQTRHQIFFDLAADVSILLPGEQCTSTIKVQVCVAETVIVGQVPETYLQIGEIP